MVLHIIHYTGNSELLEEEGFKELETLNPSSKRVIEYFKNIIDFTYHDGHHLFGWKKSMFIVRKQP